MKTKDFWFDLPSNLIAQAPLDNREDSRLLVLNASLKDAYFSQLPSFLKKDDLLIFNNTRTMKARLFGEKASGGALEMLVERLLSERTAKVMIKASRSPKKGQRIYITSQKIEATILKRMERFSIIQLAKPHTMESILEQYGRLPLPPYIRREVNAMDDERYQTVFAERLGAVATPTAGLHFSTELLNTLQLNAVETAAITLHVGAGTFMPVSAQNIAAHTMHSEWYELKQETVDAIKRCKEKSGRVIAVGTTSVRTLESAWQKHPYQAGSGDTSLFIKPGFSFQVVDGIITNFHLPESTLLMLVSAFVGHQRTMEAYQHAIEQGYRFFSYGDAMFIPSAAIPYNAVPADLSPITPL